VPEIGYDAACEIVKRAAAGGQSVRAAAVEGGYVSGEQFDALLTAESVGRLGMPSLSTRGADA
jgi:fumarate hydratase class II